MNDSPFQKAGSLIQTAVITSVSAREHALQRAQLIDRMARLQPRYRLFAAPMLAAACFACVAALLLVHPWSSAKPISFRVGADPSAGENGNYVTAPAQADLPLRFSEGSTVTLRPLARARVIQTTDRGASVVLETGQVRFDVVHRDHANWKVSAGPYTVNVTGTSFELGWSPSTAELDLRMINGVVLVQGPGLEAGVDVRDTQHFVNRATTVPANATEMAASAPSGCPSLAAPADAGAVTEPLRAGQKMTAPASSQDSWPAAVDRGQYQTVISQARAHGIDTVLGTEPEGQLSALADAARLSGNSELAQRSLLAIRSRFPKGNRAPLAAFLLGRMSDDSGNASAAIGWYNTYLAEAPSGQLAPEALGREMVALKNSGNSQEAQKTAETYLKEFPSGPYSGVAREILGR